MSTFSTISREEEARRKSTLRMILRGYCLRYRRLASASQTVQPEDLWQVFTLDPVVYLTEEIDAGVV
jgi:hypothetical protein